MSKLTGIALSLTLATALVAPALAASPEGPVPNPYLAQSYNNQSHWNDAATDSVSYPVARGFYELTPEAVQILPNEAFGLPIMTDRVAGKDMYFWWAGFSLRKVGIEDGKLVEIARSDVPVRLPGYQPVTPEQRLEQANAVQDFLDAGDEKGLLDYMAAQPNRLLTASSDQGANGAIYTLLTRDDAFVGCSGRRCFRIDQENPADPMSRMKAPVEVSMPAELFDNEKAKRGTLQQADILFGLGMTYNGYLVANTLGGKVITLDRNTLTVIDVFSVSGADELFVNSFATGPETGGGAVYVASNSNMYRLVVDKDGRIHDDDASGAWKASYDRGSRMPPPKIGDGTGSTPTLMGFGPDDDKLVVITDGASKMRLVAFWRDAMPKGWTQRAGTLSPRIADQITVDMGPTVEIVQSEQSVSAYGSYAFVVNNIIAKDTPLLSPHAYYVNTINGATRPGPRGAAAFKWDAEKDAWTKQWARDDVSSISAVPMISGDSHMAIIEGYYAGKLNQRHYIGMDLDTGKTVMDIATGSSPIHNAMYAAIKVDPAGNIFYGTAFGLVRIDASKLRRTGDF